MELRRAEIMASFLGGMAVGAAVAILLRPRSRGGSLHGGAEAVTGAVVDSGDGAAPPASGPPPAEEAWFAGWLDRREEEVLPDLPGLRARLAERHPHLRLQVGLLAPGIVEVVGVVDGPAAVRRILGEVGAERGVRTVVNRLWVEGDTV